MWQRSGLANAGAGAHIRAMRYSTLGSIAFISAVAVALMVAFLAHTVLGIPPSAIRIDALGTAACLTAFIGAGLFMQRRGK